jgi:hypothetical protein
MTSKVRIRNERLFQDSEFVDTDPTHVPHSGHGSSWTTYLDNDSMIGQDNPGWRRRIAAGGAPFGAMTGYRTESYHTHAWFRHVDLPIQFVNGQWVQNYSYSYVAQGRFSMQAISSPVEVARIVNSAKAKYVQHAANLRRSVQGGVVLGELKETIHMIMDTTHLLGRGLTGYFSALKKGKRSLRNASKQTKLNFLRQQYLQYTYGWAPLTSDIKSGAEAVARLRLSRPERSQVRSHVVGDQFISESPSSFTIGNKNVGCNVRIRDITDCHIYGAYDTSVPESNAPLTLFGLSWRDFVPTVWELIPYSFLVDYFTNIGTMITAMSYANTGLIYSGMTTKNTREATLGSYVPSLTNQSVSLNPLNPKPGIIEQFGTGTNAWKYTTVTRVTNPSLYPSFQCSLGGIDAHKVVNILALLPNFRKLTPF